MKKWILTTALLSLSCVTLRGAGYRSSEFPKLENRDCIEKAIRGVDGVEFVERKKEKSEGNAFFKNEKREFAEEIFTYRFATANDLLTDASFVISDQYSGAGKYESTSVEHHFGQPGGRNFTMQQREVAKTTLEKVNQAIQKQCNLPPMKMELYQY